jgi:multiple antibiotic resistance protein
LDLVLFISEFSKAALSLFIIVDPFGNIPIFVGLTENVQYAQKKKVYNTATIVGMILLLVFHSLGQSRRNHHNHI